ncbi:hypothetical protein L6164_009211 [Bauhinia variegata]|uniref:Uncharacterized protein n=1 Tax=Bauhinia variegata TaxID=167791 RepID=A0ACB9PIX8_BAUVA|nr:hypothetical protein L6164_009211 [Bauhinia variegata]
MIGDSQNTHFNDDVGGRWSQGFASLIRRKQVDSAHVKREGHQLARKLSIVDLVAIGVGATIGAGVYILVGTVAREHTGPALPMSILIAGIAAALSAFCYAELSCRCPSAGSAYHYTYICIGEGVAWLVGWALILEYTIGGSAVARGLTPNLALFFGGEENVPSFLARHTILGIVVDPCAAVLVFIVTLLLCIGIKESSTAQTIVTTINVCAMLFIIITGGYLGFKTAWVGYELPSGYFPFGVNGVFSGAAIIFFSYIGFDSVASTAEEVKNPQRDLPLAFASYGMEWAVYIITTGAVTALCSSLLGSVLPQPRILMAMARDGLLPSFFSDINQRTQVPVKSTIVTGILAAALAFFMDVSQLSGMVSVGTLLAFTTVAVSVLILRYVPPDEVPVPSSLCTSVDPVSLHFGVNVEEEDRGMNPVDADDYCENSRKHLHDETEALLGHPLIIKEVTEDKQREQTRRKVAASTIAILCIGILILASAASAEGCPSILRFTLFGVGGLLLLCSIIVLACTDQDDARHSFGHTGGFVCPFVPFLPAACILINTYLLIELGAATWIRVSVGRCLRLLQTESEAHDGKLRTLFEQDHRPLLFPYRVKHRHKGGEEIAPSLCICLLLRLKLIVVGARAVDSQEGGGQDSWSSFRFLTRRKLVDSADRKAEVQLAKELSVPHLIAVGVGATIGAGVYVLVGTVAREHSGPALAISFLIAGIAAALSAFCYAELASRCPSAGSAYHYSYICLGEGVAWLIGWALILEYTIGGAAVARGITPNMAELFGGPDSLPFFLARQHIPWLGIVVDPCAAILVFIVTGLLCVGIKESTLAQGIITSVNICALIFVVVAGSYLGFKSGWVGYKLSTGGYFPFGVDGMLAGSATVFFAYIGFDAVASTAEEVKNPQRDLPLGIGVSLFLCCALYMMVSVVIVGIVPYYAIDPDTPISSAFANHGMQWVAYIINAGAFTALCAALMGSLLPQPRILMAMARDGLLPPFFSDIHKSTQVPVKSTITTGLVAAVLAFVMDVSQLAGMVSVGTLLAFTMVAISVLILRYIPPDEVPLPNSLHESIHSVSFRYSRSNDEKDGNDAEVNIGTSGGSKPSVAKEDVSIEDPLIPKHLDVVNYINEGNRRKFVGWVITFTCLGVFVLTYTASDLSLLSSVRFTLCGIGGTLLLSGLVILNCIAQDDARHNFGHSGGFVCPFVPLLPIACILINSYLLINLGGDTWIRVSVWLAIGLLVYIFYGRTHSSLKDAIYVPANQVDEIYRTSTSCLA